MQDTPLTGKTTDRQILQGQSIAFSVTQEQPRRFKVALKPDGSTRYKSRRKHVAAKTKEPTIVETANEINDDQQRTKIEIPGPSKN